MITIQAAKRGARADDTGRIGLALAGGGALGIVYEAGVLRALAEALEGLDLNALHAYVGVSAGALVAASLANQFDTKQVCCILMKDEASEYPFNAETFMAPAFGAYLSSIASIPGILVESLGRYIRNPRDIGLLESLMGLSRAIPTGVFENDTLQEFFAHLFSMGGRTNDFRELGRNLEIVAVDLDTGESVTFGSAGYEHVPISRACQASAALPGLYPPVEIDGRYYVDGALQKTLHASVAFEAGASLALCINPIVPFDASLAALEGSSRHDKLVQGGLPVVLSQTFRAIIHSRMRVGMAKYETQYENADVLLFEPNADDSRMFFTNVFSFANRRRVCEHAYQTTREDLRLRRSALEPILAKHGLRLRHDVLDEERHFWTEIDEAADYFAQRQCRNSVTNDLTDGLNRLQRWLAARN